MPRRLTWEFTRLSAVGPVNRTQCMELRVKRRHKWTKMVKSSTTCALGSRWAKPPGPKFKKWGGAGVQWAPKWGKSPRIRFLSFGQYFWILGSVCVGGGGVIVNFFIFKKRLCLSACVRLGACLRSDWAAPRRARARDGSSSLLPSPSVGWEEEEGGRRRRSDAMLAPERCPRRVF